MSELREAKELFVAKGQIRDKVVSRELSVSWRRCKMYGLLPSHPILCDEAYDPEEDEFTEYCDRVVPEFISFFVTNKEGEVLFRRTDNTELHRITSLSERMVGTTSHGIAANLKKDAVVRKDEHYLDCLSIFTSRTIYVPSHDVMITLFYRGVDNEYVYMSVKNSIMSYLSEDHFKLSSENKPADISDYIDVDKYLIEELENKLIVTDSRFPVLIIGEDADALAWYMADRGLFSALRVSHKGIPDSMLEDKLIDVSKKTSALIISDLHDCSERYLSLVAQIVDYMIENGEKKKKQIFLTAQSVFKSERIMNKLQLSTILLPDYLKNANVDFAYKTIQEMEAELIGATLEATNWNPSLAAKKLGIGRATLYRKMKLYQFENNGKISN